MAEKITIRQQWSDSLVTGRQYVSLYRTVSKDAAKIGSPGSTRTLAIARTPETAGKPATPRTRAKAGTKTTA